MASVPVADVYLQYDLFMSLVWIPFLTLKLDPIYFQLVAESSIWLFLVAILWYAKRWIRHRSVLVGFVLTLFLVKIYGILHDPALVIQVTPLRLEWWLLPLVLIWSFGLRHWSVGFSLGVLLVLHKTFGLIYTLAYLELLGVWFLVSWSDFFKTMSASSALREAWRKQLTEGWAAILLLMFGLLVSALLYRNVGLSDAALLYQQLGIGFDRISPNSFYWYVPIVLGSSVWLLIVNRARLGDRYVVQGLGLVFFALGNSVYFFGRSHEHNILNIAAVLLLVLFMLVDVLRVAHESGQLPQNIWRGATLQALPLVILWYATCTYSASIIHRSSQQWKMLRTGAFLDHPSYDIEIRSLQAATHGSSKVFVMTSDDFMIYYYGNWVPPAYLSPYCAWTSKPDLIEYAQGLLDQGYYIIYEQPDEQIAALAGFGSKVQVGNYTILAGVNADRSH